MSTGRHLGESEPTTTYLPQGPFLLGQRSPWQGRPDFSADQKPSVLHPPYLGVGLDCQHWASKRRKKKKKKKKHALFSSGLPECSLQSPLGCVELLDLEAHALHRSVTLFPQFTQRLVKGLVRLGDLVVQFQNLQTNYQTVNQQKEEGEKKTRYLCLELGDNHIRLNPKPLFLFELGLQGLHSAQEL